MYPLYAPSGIVVPCLRSIWRPNSCQTARRCQKKRRRDGGESFFHARFPRLAGFGVPMCLGSLVFPAVFGVNCLIGAVRIWLWAGERLHGQSTVSPIAPAKHWPRLLSRMTQSGARRDFTQFEPGRSLSVPTLVRLKD